jgi:carboxymethylenebutenolidase
LHARAHTAHHTPRVCCAVSADTLPAAIVGKAAPPSGSTVGYYAADPNTHGYLALPKGGGKHGAVILIHEWNGLNDRVRQVADALAAEGYVALAADMYSGKTGSTPQENMALMKTVTDNPQVSVANLDAAAKFLRARSDVSGKIATIGWCFGGGVALNYGIEGQHHQGTAMFYGRLVNDPAQLAKMHHPLYGTFAGKDTGIPPAAVDSFVTALRSAGIKNDVHVYDEVGHGFWLWVDRDPAHATAPALDAWKRLKVYLAANLK